MRRRLLITLTLAAALALAAVAANAVACPTVPVKKVAVCKYVGKPGVNELLKSGKNPIVVSINSLVGPHGAQPVLGQAFSDAQGRSVVVALPGMPIPAEGSCPQGQGPQEGAPATPVITAATCTSGEVLAMPADTEDITYTETGALAGPSTVVVTATAQDGYVIAPTSGWVLTADRHSATWTVTLGGPRTDGCYAPVKATPTDPTITAASCQSGEQLGMPRDADGIAYTETGALAGPGTVVVTAHAADGYVIGSAEGWQVAEDQQTATWTSDLAGPLTTGCNAAPVKVTPADPTITKATCTHGEQLPMPANTADITYTETGALTGPSTVVLTATATGGRVIVAGGAWQVAANGQSATLTVHLAGPLTTGCSTTPGGTTPSGHKKSSHHHAAPPSTGSPSHRVAFTL
jgi:hypothetical protein